MDNFFSSPGLFKGLADNQTAFASRIDVAETIMQAKPKAAEPPVVDSDGHTPVCFLV